MKDSTNLLKQSNLVPKLLDAILFQPNLKNDNQQVIEEPEFETVDMATLDFEKKYIVEGNLNQMFGAGNKYRGIDRYVVEQLNHTLFSSTKNMKMKLRNYQFNESESEVEENEESNNPEKLKSGEKKATPPEKQSSILTLDFLCNRENRICDETSFIISRLQESLDKQKTQNYYSLTMLANQIDNQQIQERMRNFNMIEKISGPSSISKGITSSDLMNNLNDQQPSDSTDQKYQNKLQLLRNILMKVKMQKRENRSKLRASNVPQFNPKKLYNMQQAREQKQFSVGDGKFISDKTIVKKTFVGYKQSREQRTSILDEIEANIVPEDELPVLDEDQQSYKRQKLDAGDSEEESCQDDGSEHENGEDGQSTPQLPALRLEMMDLLVKQQKPTEDHRIDQSIEPILKLRQGDNHLMQLGIFSQNPQMSQQPPPKDQQNDV